MMDENDGVVQLQETRGEAGEVPPLKTEAESAHQNIEDVVINAGINDVDIVEASAYQSIEDVVINAGINVVDIIGSDCHYMTQKANKAELFEGPRVIVDVDGAECSNIDGKWDRKADHHCEPIVKDFVYDHSITNSSDVVVNNVDEDEDILSTLSRWTGEHSLRY